MIPKKKHQPHTSPPSGRANLHLVPPPPDDFENWKRLMNLLFLLEEDRLFEWLRVVRSEVEELT